ncbi:DNA-binding transcriptional response regulator, NtrC family, contains REC, AAA-type ATPase, and a Fis-type DNA-binding domains [Sphingomonas sp. OV641]|uniref:sigma-54-dependent transcriptional regulator n=1 Tax=Sphingomonas sp. OV641 TaxID=1881068 RepID=UPI0008D3A71E|nr:sigma-54 dependent transcriptional regulator [Sphingomonas sp. OV641]SEI78134.1 DNA-binding transcriptional response regulator, NtrC family, contains REC, AAA-type ATPase, and a Fis-type DNA-binding domains [Sphingomonas sp. OV641]
MTQPNATRLLLVGQPGSEFRLAAEMARDAGAHVDMADAPAQALALLRSDGAMMVMIDVGLDAAGFLAQLRAERFTLPVIACGINASADQAVSAIRAGARDYVPLPPERSLIAAAIASIAPTASSVILGEDPALARAVSFGLSMATARVPVLLCGERSTGKELLARHIHDASGCSGRFEIVECAGASPEVIASELFGHEAGAFPGAVARRIGRLEKAHKGTLLLRNVDLLPPTIQADLAHALRSGVIRRMNGTASIALDARLMVSATTSLADRVAAGTFRADLVSHLELVQLCLPPLRERGQDILCLALRQIEDAARAEQRPAPALSEEAAAALLDYDWPGNVRELQDVMHRAVLLARGNAIEPSDLVLTDGRQLAPAAPRMELGLPKVESLVGRTVEEVERELILQTLEHCHGNRTSASSILGISVRTMRNKLKSFIEAGIAVSPAA